MTDSFGKKRERESRGDARGSYLRALAILFALLLLICLPLVCVYISLVPVSEPGFFSLLSVPMDTLLKMLGALICGIIVLFCVMMARGIRK